MSVAKLLDTLGTLEQLCQGTLDECISCPNESDYILVRLSLCPCHSTIRYGICANCRDTAASEGLIETEMREAHLRGQRETPEEFQGLIQEALGQSWW